MRMSPGQLRLDLVDGDHEHADLDLEHAQRWLAADLAAAPPAPTCVCLPGPLRGDGDDRHHCIRCGREVPV
jgi:hypothetical protein